MSLHKLTAGDGYEYLTRQVAAADSTELGHRSLGEYYAEKGESPGVWMGRGLDALTGDYAVNAGDRVAEEQMKALFGEGLHPNADKIIGGAIDAYRSEQVAVAEAKLGSPFKVYKGLSEYRVAVARRFDAHNKARGEKWNTPIDADVRAQIRTEVSREFFTKEYGRSPLDDRELSGWMAKLSRQQTDATAGFDCTFSPVKSFSTLWATAPREIAEQLEAAHHAAVADAIAFLEEHAAFTRLGTNGVAQVDTDGLMIAGFTHRDTRAGDPDLHTHCAISNKVRTVGPDGIARWLALDARLLHKLTVAASEVYNSRLEGHVMARVPASFAERASVDLHKQPVREIVGVSTDLNEQWASRRAAIEVRIGQLSRDFQAAHGREPTAIEAIDLAQQANLETRGAKHEPRSLAQQRAAWRSEAIDILGGEHAVESMVADALSHPYVLGEPITAQWIGERAHKIVGNVEGRRSRWQFNHLRAEAERAVRVAGVPVDQMDSVARALTSTATDALHSVTLSAPLDRSLELTPHQLRRRDGASVYTTAHAQLYTSQPILDAETRLLRAAGERGAGRVGATDVDLALLESTANGIELNAGQAAMVRRIATSGNRVDLVLAPAGTGKTKAMEVLTNAWTNVPGHSVVGLAPTAAAAAVLREDIHTDTDNLAKLNHLIFSASEDPHRPALPDGLAHRARAHGLAQGLLPTSNLPRWFENIGPGSLVMVDEAGMASTPDLDLAVDYLRHRGAKIALVGDDRQLASVSAGGVLRDIAETHGSMTLSHVVRFTDPAEGAASLALRSGDEAALGYYLDHGRIHVGSLVSATDAVYTNWAADIAAGHDSVMFAYTRDTVNELNARARADRLTRARSPGPVGRILRPGATREVTLSDGLAASVGDTVCTRVNQRTLAMTQTDWVRNGDRWHVQAVHRDGSLRVKHLGIGRSIDLPADYVRSNTTLGYARTIHGGQGLTAGDAQHKGTSHTLFTGAESRELLYVPLTRGRDENHAYFATASDGDLHDVMTAKGTLPPTVLDMLREILARDNTQVSAHSTVRELADPARRLAHTADSYVDAIGSGAEHLLGPEQMRRIDSHAERIHPGLTEQPAWPTLRKHLATIGIDGRDPVTALTAAVNRRELESAVDVAAVLDWRLDATGNHSAGAGPLPWLPEVPARLDREPGWGDYLRARAQEVGAQAEQIRRDTTSWTPASAAAWARPFVGTDNPALLADLAVFRAARRVDATDRRLTGRDEFAHTPRKAQEALNQRAFAVIDDPASVAKRWEPLADSIDRHLVDDPFWLELADNLDRLSRAGVDVARLATTAAAQRPLPDELPAAALWWRLAGDLDPGALDATGREGQLRPAWTPALVDLLGEHQAQRVIDDARWPGLVAAVESAGHTGWTPAELLGTAHELLTAGQDDAAVRVDELAAALTYRVELLVRGHALAADYVPPDEAPILVDDEHTLPADPEAVQPAPADYTPVDEPADAVPVATVPDVDEQIPPAEPPPLDDELPPPPEDDYAPDGWDPDSYPVGDTAFDQPSPAAAELTAAAARVEAARLAADTAHRDVDALFHEIRDGRSPAVVAATPMLDQMRADRDTQRPYRIAVLDAHQDWIAADAAAEAATLALRELVDQRALTELTGGDTTSLDTAISTARAESDRLTAIADDTRDTALSAVDELRTVAGPRGIVTDNDVQHALLTVEDIDVGRLNQLRGAALSADGAVFRAETAAARTAVAVAERPATSGDSPLDEPATPPEPAVLEPTVRADAAVLEPVVSAPVERRGVDPELAAALDQLRANLDTTRPGAAAWLHDPTRLLNPATRREPSAEDARLDRAADLYTDTLRLAEQAAAVHAAATHLPTHLDPATDPDWPALRDRLADAHRHGRDTDTLTRGAVDAASTDPAAPVSLRTITDQIPTEPDAAQHQTRHDRYAPAVHAAFGEHAPTLLADPAWPQLAEHLDHVEHTGTRADRALTRLARESAGAGDRTPTAGDLGTRAETTWPLGRERRNTDAPDWITPPPASTQPALDQWAHREYDTIAAHTRDLARAVHEEQPTWAAQLPPRPDDQLRQHGWDRTVGHVAAYREQHEITSATHPLGQPPTHDTGRQRVHDQLAGRVDELRRQQPTATTPTPSQPESRPTAPKPPAAPQQPRPDQQTPAQRLAAEQRRRMEEQRRQQHRRPPPPDAGRRGPRL